MNRDEELVPVYEAANPGVAEFIRALLEEEGILGFVKDRDVPYPGVPLEPSRSGPSFVGCSVVVRRRDAERAAEVLREARRFSLPDEEEE